MEIFIEIIDILTSNNENLTKKMMNLNILTSILETYLTNLSILKILNMQIMHKAVILGWLYTLSSL